MPETNDLRIDKIYIFTKSSYLVSVRFDIISSKGQPINLGISYRIVRDHSGPEGQDYFTCSYVGPMVYPPESGFQKASFSDLDDDTKSGESEAGYTRKTSTDWLGMTERHLMSAWILQPKDGQSVYAADDCHINIRRHDGNLYSVSISAPPTAIQAGVKTETAVNLYAGPQATSVIANIADKLQLAKDYGKVRWFASLLSQLLNQLHSIIGDQGWAIIVLTITTKAVLYSLTNAFYHSTIKMCVATLKLQAIKKRHGDDRMTQQQATMQSYKNEKINPLGGCLPTLLQIPVFVGLYWTLFASVELRRAPWLGWITDLNRPDPLYILLLITTTTMLAQTYLDPPSTDPMQARTMKVMSLIFSIMPFFFLAGLILYWVISNFSTIAQQ